jgi:hypothetical protein
MIPYHLDIITILITKGIIKGFAILIVLSGWALKYWINRRKFYRRNTAGIEEFTSYEKMRLTVVMEGLGWLIGNLLIIAGILLFLLTLVQPSGYHK